MGKRNDRMDVDFESTNYVWDEDDDDDAEDESLFGHGVWDIIITAEVGHALPTRIALTSPLFTYVSDGTIFCASVGCSLVPWPSASVGWTSGA